MVVFVSEKENLHKKNYIKKTELLNIVNKFEAWNEISFLHSSFLPSVVIIMHYYTKVKGKHGEIF